MKLSRLKIFSRERRRDKLGQSFKGYPAFFEHVLRGRPRDEAMIEAVGGGHDIGDMEATLLDRFGLATDSYVIDVGCGSGRLARPLARLPQLRYLGTDISQTLLDYAAHTSSRADSGSRALMECGFASATGVADMVAFFSVGTH